MSRFAAITVQETLDPTVSATKKTSTRPSTSNAATKRVDPRDLVDVEGLQRTLQAVVDQVDYLSRIVSSMPFFGGLYIARLELNSTTPVTIRHGIDGYVDVMLTVASNSTGGVASFDITEQSPTARTVKIRSNRDCMVAALIYPQKRGT